MTDDPPGADPAETAGAAPGRDAAATDGAAHAAGGDARATGGSGTPAGDRPAPAEAAAASGAHRADPDAETAAPAGPTTPADPENATDPAGPTTAADPASSADPATAADPASSADPAKPRLKRGRADDRVIAGVCHGAGQFFGVDPVIFRVVLAVLSLTGGIGLIVYGMGWLVVPQEGERESEAHRLLSGRIEGAPLTAVLMALVGCGLYASMLGNGTNQAFSLLLLAATAGAVYWSQQRRKLEAAGDLPAPGAGPGGATRVASAVPDAPPAVQAPPEPGGTPSWWREPLGKAPSYLWGPEDGPAAGGTYTGGFAGALGGAFDALGSRGRRGGPHSKQDAAAWKARRRAERSEHGAWFAFTVFLVAIAAAALGTGVAWPYQPAGVAAEIGLAAALGVFGTAFVIASFAGRARGGTVFFSLLAIAGLIGAAMLPKAGQGVRTSTWRPLTPAAVQAVYERGAGRGVLDLTRLPLDGRTVSTRVTLGAGEVQLLLPRGATAHINYDIGVGDVKLAGQARDQGVDVRSDRHDVITLYPPPGTAPGGTIDVKVNVGIGELKVVR